jgi:hypothetical protein
VFKHIDGTRGFLVHDSHDLQQSIAYFYSFLILLYIENTNEVDYKISKQVGNLTSHEYNWSTFFSLHLLMKHVETIYGSRTMGHDLFLCAHLSHMINNVNN